MLYDHFNKSLWDKIGQQDQSFFDEVDEFKSKVAQVNVVCFKDLNEANSKRTFEIPLMLKRNIPSELKDICKRLKYKDKEYIRILKDKQNDFIKKMNQYYIGKFYYQLANQSRIFYEFENREDFNLTRTNSPYKKK